MRNYPLILIALVLALAIPHAVRAQDGGVDLPDAGPSSVGELPPDEAAPDTPEPAAVPEGSGSEVAAALPVHLRPAALSDLTTRTRVALRDARPHFWVHHDEARIVRELPRLREDMRLREESGELERAETLTRRELHELHRTWRREEELFHAWEQLLHQKSEGLEGLRSTMVELHDLWASREREAVEAGVPDALVERVQSILAEVIEAEGALRERRDEVLILIDEVELREGKIIEALDLLEEAEDAFRRRLLERNAPPIQQGLTASGHEGRTLDPTRHLHEIEALWKQDSIFRRRLLALAGSVPFLALILLAIRRRGEREASGAPLDGTMRRLSRRPIAASLLAVLIFAPYVFPHAPVALRDAFYLSVLPPLMLVLPPFLGASARRIGYAMLFVLGLVETRALFLEGGGAQRVVLLLAAVLTIGGALAFAAKERGRGAPWLHNIVGLGGVIAAASIVANLAGFTMLGAVLIGGVVESAHAAFTVLSLAIFAEAVVGFALAHRPLSRLQSVKSHGRGIFDTFHRLIQLASILLFLRGVAAAFGIEGTIQNLLVDAFSAQFTVGDVRVTLGSALIFVAILLGTHIAARLIGFGLDTDILPHFELEVGLDAVISRLTRYTIYGLGLLLALASVGIDPARLALVAGALSVGIGFGLQTIVGNFISGLILMFERPIRIGDFIEVGDLVGAVTRIGVRSSTIRCQDGSEVIVPNEALISREVVNWTLSDRKRRVEVKVGVAYGTDPKKVVAVLEEAARGFKDVLTSPPPTVLFEAFGDSSLDFTIQTWTPRFRDWRVLRSEMTRRVHDALDAEGIEIPFPHRHITVQTVSSEEPEAPDAKS